MCDAFTTRFLLARVVEYAFNRYVVDFTDIFKCLMYATCLVLHPSYIWIKCALPVTPSASLSYCTCTLVLVKCLTACPSLVMWLREITIPWTTVFNCRCLWVNHDLLRNFLYYKVIKDPHVTLTVTIFEESKPQTAASQAIWSRKLNVKVGVMKQKHGGQLANFLF